MRWVEHMAHTEEKRNAYRIAFFFWGGGGGPKKIPHLGELGKNVIKKKMHIMGWN
jgi:hypothetical protein